MKFRSNLSNKPVYAIAFSNSKVYTAIQQILLYLWQNYVFEAGEDQSRQC